MDDLKKIGVGDLRLLAVCVFLALLQGAVFAGIQTSATGALSFPLDDSYIHLQYAKQIARGEYFQYQDGDPVSSGATSILYVHLLALGYLIGFRGEAFPVWALAIAALSVSWTFYLLIQLGKRWGSSFAGWAAFLLVFVSGILAWGFWSGMEIALFSSILLSAFYLLYEAQPLKPIFFIMLGLLSLCRPEGVIVSVVLSAGLAMGWLGKGFSRIRLFYPRMLLSILFFILSIILPMLFFRQTTGLWGGNGMLAKSLLHQPIMSGWEIVWEFSVNCASIAVFLLGYFQGEPGEYGLPGLLLFTILGLVGLARLRGGEWRWRTLLAGAALALALIAIAVLEVWRMHNYRYILPFFPILFLLGTLGVERVYQWLRLHGSVAQTATIAIAFLLSVLYYPAWAARFAENSTTIYEKQRRTAQWISKQWYSRHFPPASSVAINDAGALVYYAQPQDEGQRMLDLVGLVSNGLANVYRTGEGGLYEWLERLPVDKRPAYAAVFPSWFNEMSRVYDVFYRPMVSFPDPFDPGFGKTVFEINWNYSGMEDEPRKATLQPGWVIRDRVDIGDVISERQHRYQFENKEHRFPKIPVPFRRNFGYHEEIDERWPNVEKEQQELIPVLQQDGTIYQYDILDAGRRITGEESFVLENLEPNRDAWLILRTCDGSGDYPVFQYRMNVYVEDSFIQTCTAEGTPWNWYEFVVKIPADSIRKPQITVRVINQGSSKFKYYDSFYYWIGQNL